MKLIKYLNEELDVKLSRWYALFLVMSSIWVSTKLLYLFITGSFRLINRIPSREEREQKKLEREYATMVSDN